MSYQYKVKKKKTSLSGELQYKFYASPKASGTINTDQVAKEIEDATTFTKSDVLGAIAALTAVIERRIKNGYSVKLNGLGTFSLSVTSEGFTDAAKCTPHKVKAGKICLRADSKLKKSIEGTVFERDIYEQRYIDSLKKKKPATKLK
ncbi:MAG: HU family DNA-binding protein [Bacteroidales bacterium]|nr:HU family DNA-binding protein [Bacteroidales bacterium]